jgi:hypothetical protein
LLTRGKESHGDYDALSSMVVTSDLAGSKRGSRASPGCRRKVARRRPTCDVRGASMAVGVASRRNFWPFSCFNLKPWAE